MFASLLPLRFSMIDLGYDAMLDSIQWTLSCTRIVKVRMLMTSSVQDDSTLEAWHLRDW